ncbi:MAG: heavy-metal-associated domain-containing protein [Gemmatimonadetes bacterium]|nr:heavy-metal-associated domain-containing protein [Gemmatimonadota bacterium]
MITAIQLSGMRTVHCVRAVRTALMALDGVDAVDVQVGRVVLEHRSAITADAITAAIAVTPYLVESITTNGRSLRVL